MSSTELICPLCLKDVLGFHPKSHVIPAFISRELGDEKGRSIHLGGDGTRKTIQSGDYGSIVCNPCEISFNPYDRFFAHCFKDKSIKFHVERFKFRDGHIERWTGLDFEKLYGFCISIVIRATLLSRKKVVNNVLSSNHYDELARMFKSKSFDDDRYPLLIRKLTSTKDLANITYYPNKGRVAGHNAVVWAFLGYEFRLFTSSHSIPEEILKLKLNRSGECFVLEEDASRALSIKKIIQQHEIEKQKFQKNKNTRQTR